MIKFINADVRTVVSNAENKLNEPVYICFDENMVEVARTNEFMGTDCKIGLAIAPDRRMVLLECLDQIDIDTGFVSEFRPPYHVIPSSRGMYEDPPRAITVPETGRWYNEVLIKDIYVGRYKPEGPGHLYVECAAFLGEQV